MHGGKIRESLKEVRKSVEKVATSATHVHRQALPPTADAATYHGFRVFCQVQEWKGVQLDSTEWGWEVVDGIMSPIDMGKQPAPPELLKFIRCGCH